MSNVRDLLIELGTEELPPKALRKLMQAFAAGMEQGLIKAELHFSEIKAFATPRRLSVIVKGMDVHQQDRLVERRGPAITAAFDEDGNPTKALQGFAKSCGVTMDNLEKVEAKKGSWLVYKRQEAGAKTVDLIAKILQQSLNYLPIPKRMRWGNLSDEFIRPVHWLIVLFGDEVVPVELLGVKAARDSYGHRFHHQGAIRIKSAQTYVSQMETKGYVIVDIDKRREMIREQVLARATNLDGKAVINDDLLDEVTAMVEWPVVLSGSYDAGFLDLPEEVLVFSMEKHQKYFAVQDKKGNLLPYFIMVCNIESRDPAQVIAGNERVILPRLSDSAFFWETDRKKSLAARQNQLKTIIFQNKLGTVYEKSARVAKLAAAIASKMGSNVELAKRAALLAKCDLVTEMVKEFPELQGIMGRYYAGLDGEHDEVADALNEQYLPRFAGDKLPQTPSGQAVSLADKIETLVGLFGIGQPPTGVKDPFSLRRSTLGILRIIIENNLDLDLAELLDIAGQDLKAILGEEVATKPIMSYVYDRLRGYAADQGFKADVFEAVLAVKPTKPIDFMKRLTAVKSFREIEQAKALAAGNKRINNILRKNDVAGEIQTINEGLLQEQAEKVLANKLKDIKAVVKPLISSSDHTEVLIYLASMRESIDSFFDKVMVMVNDDALKNNRLALLNQIRSLFLEVADISLLQE